MASGRVLPYLDVPFQHSHPEVLKRMKRPASGEKNLERLQRWREACPELVVRPSSPASRRDRSRVRGLLEFIREAQIDRAGCFAYSPVEGAAANQLPGLLSAELREERRARFMAVAEEVSTRKLAARVGATMQVLIDEAPALGRRGGWAQLCRRARDRRPRGAPAAAGEGVEDPKVGEFTRAASSRPKATTSVGAAI